MTNSQPIRMRPKETATGAAGEHAEQLHELALWLAVRQTAPQELSHGAKLCWNVIAQFERSGLECWAGLLKMGHEVGVTEGQASRYIAELVKEKYIHKTVGRSGRPIYQRLQHPDLIARAEKLYQEIQANAKKSNG